MAFSVRRRAASDTVVDRRLGLLESEQNKFAGKSPRFPQAVQDLQDYAEQGQLQLHSSSTSSLPCPSDRFGENPVHVNTPTTRTASVQSLVFFPTSFEVSRT